MKILALDSATGACSAALWHDGTILARRFAVMERGQSEVLIPMAQAVLAESGLGTDFSGIDCFGVTTGPGAFTGLRIGLAAARGMALAAGRPLVGVTTFEAVAHGLPQEERHGRTILVAVESRREDIFVQSFDNYMISPGPPCAVLPADLQFPAGPLVIAGDAAARLRPVLEHRLAHQLDRQVETAGMIRFAAGSGYPDAADVARLVAGFVAERGIGSISAQPPQPLYIRPPDAALPAPWGR